MLNKQKLKVKQIIIKQLDLMIISNIEANLFKWLLINLLQVFISYLTNKQRCIFILFAKNNKPFLVLQTFYIQYLSNIDFNVFILSLNFLLYKNIFNQKQLKIYFSYKGIKSSSNSRESPLTS